MRFAGFEPTVSRRACAASPRTSRCSTYRARSLVSPATDFSRALRAALPIYVVFLGTIAFAIYFPKVVLWLPKQVIPESVGCFKNPSGSGYICP